MNRVLSIDYGEKRIGLAISDLLKIIAKPFETIIYTNDKDLINSLLKIIKEQKINQVVVGLPLTFKGEHSEQTKKVLVFIDLLKNELNVPIVSYDERLSSVSAKKSLITQGVKTGYSKSEVDKTAAAIFLQSYLDSNAIKK